GFPARVYAQFLPELRGSAKLMALEPFAQRRIVLRIRLDLSQGRELCFRGGMLALRLADCFCGVRARFLQGRALRLQGVESLVRCLERSVDLRDTCFELAQRRGIGLGERLPLRVQ